MKKMHTDALMEPQYFACLEWKGRSACKGPSAWFQ